MQSIFEAIGTTWDVEAVCPDIRTEQICREIITSRIETFDKTYSRFRKDSLIWRLSVDGGSIELPEDFIELITFYKQLYDYTSGIFTPLIGNTLIDAGYDESYSLTSHTLHQPPTWEDSIRYDTHSLTVNKPVMLDFGAAGKGYVVDIISKIFIERNIQDFTINAGGDILHRGKSSIRIGLEHPKVTSEVIGTVDINNKAICGSSGSRRAWGNYHHIMNPFTLNSPTKILSVWVISDKAIVADGISTALFFVEPEVFENKFQFEYFIIYDDYSFKKSKGFNADIFTS